MEVIYLFISIKRTHGAEVPLSSVTDATSNDARGARMFEFF